MMEAKMFDSLFNKVILLWPENFVVAEKMVYRDGGANIPILASIHDEIVKNLTAIDDNQMLLHMDWAIYTVLHQAARIQAEIFPKNIDVEMVRKIFERNLELERNENEGQQA